MHKVHSGYAQVETVAIAEDHTKHSWAVWLAATLNSLLLYWLPITKSTTKRIERIFSKLQRDNCFFINAVQQAHAETILP
jgi:hypothetical protein